MNPTPAELLAQARTDGLRVLATPEGLRVSGSRESVDRWRPHLAAAKTEILRLLRGDEREADDESEAAQLANSGTGTLAPGEHDEFALDDLTMQARRREVLAMLWRNFSATYGIFAQETPSGPCRVTLAIRGVGTCELEIPRDRYDGLRLMELVEKVQRGGG